MLVKECKRIKLDQGRRYGLSKTERAQFKGQAFIIKRQSRLYFLTEEGWNRFQPVEKPAGLQKTATRRINRAIGLGIISLVRIDSRGRLPIPPTMREKKRAR